MVETRDYWAHSVGTGLLTTMVACLCTACPAQAQLGGINWAPPDLIARSDAICVGTVKSVHMGGRENFQMNKLWVGGKHLVIPTILATASVGAEVTIKGVPLTGDFAVTFPVDSRTPAPDTPWLGALATLRVGGRALVFLRRATDAGFSLLSPDNQEPTVWPLSTPLPKTTGPPLTPIRQIMLILAAEAARGGGAPGMDALHLLGTCGQILYYWDYNARARYGPGEISEHMDALRTQLGEPRAAGLEAFVEERIIPGIAPLFSTDDVNSRSEVLWAAGYLQDTDAIPSIVAAIHAAKGGRYEFLDYVLSQFRVRAALKTLVGLLKDESPRVRAAAAGALRDMNNEEALPYLLDSLQDTDYHVWFLKTQALALISGDYPHVHWLAGFQLSPADKSRADAFWRQWAKAHASEMQKLRARFNAGSDKTVAPP